MSLDRFWPTQNNNVIRARVIPIKLLVTLSDSDIMQDSPPAKQPRVEDEASKTKDVQDVVSHLVDSVSILGPTLPNVETSEQMARYGIKFKIESFRPLSALNNHVYECPITLHPVDCDSSHLSDIEFQEMSINALKEALMEAAKSSLPNLQEQHIQIRIHNENLHKPYISTKFSSPDNIEKIVNEAIEKLANARQSEKVWTNPGDKNLIRLEDTEFTFVKVFKKGL